MKILHTHRAARTQAGMATLLVLVSLLVLFIGALFAFRADLTDTGLTDHFSQRQQAVISSDLALQWIATQMLDQSGGEALEVTGAGQPWFLSNPPNPSNGGAWPPANWQACTPGDTSSTAPVCPAPSYWSSCIAGNSTTDTCASVPMPASTGKQAWGVVIPTGFSDPYACATQGMVAMYYDIWTHVVDPRTQVSADSESLYKLCVISGS